MTGQPIDRVHQIFNEEEPLTLTALYSTLKRQHPLSLIVSPSQLEFIMSLAIESIEYSFSAFTVRASGVMQPLQLNGHPCTQIIYLNPGPKDRLPRRSIACTFNMEPYSFETGRVSRSSILILSKSSN